MLNFKHLRYFWVVAKQGSVVKASESLHVTPQTISGQINQLEADLGQPLLKKAGRGLQLTSTGKLVLSYAEEIFALGGELEERLQHTNSDEPIVLRVGVADAVPKSIASRILRPALTLQEHIRFVCKENSQDNLLAEMALHRLDMVLADGPIPNNVGIRGFNHKLGASGISFMASSKITEQLHGHFPQCLNDAPLLLPSDVSLVHLPLLQWLEDNQLTPRITGEFDDSALMKAFGHDGVGVFVVPSAIAEDVSKQYEAIEIGRTDEVTESFFVIVNERNLSNPAISTIIENARHWLGLKEH
jgi:LysR family transcriptional activator of nhaA